MRMIALLACMAATAIPIPSTICTESGIFFNEFSIVCPITTAAGTAPSIAAGWRDIVNSLGKNR